MSNDFRSVRNRNYGNDDVVFINENLRLHILCVANFLPLFFVLAPLHLHSSLNRWQDSSLQTPKRMLEYFLQISSNATSVHNGHSSMKCQFGLIEILVIYRAFVLYLYGGREECGYGQQDYSSVFREYGGNSRHGALYYTHWLISRDDKKHF